MILKNIRINNIRSIKNINVGFPRSTILFYGDIGAGKSSILKAIEFALFGILPSADLNSESLLRRGEDRASVELTFSIGENEYTITRYLTKNDKGKISQSKQSYIIENGKKQNFSAQAMRRKILEILNYSIVRYEKAKKIWNKRPNLLTLFVLFSLIIFAILVLKEYLSLMEEVSKYFVFIGFCFLFSCISWILYCLLKKLKAIEVNYNHFSEIP